MDLIWVFATGSDPELRIALWAGTTAFGLTFMILLALVVMRWRQRRQVEEYIKFISEWRPVMMDAILGNEPMAPKLSSRHRLFFLLLWNEFRESLRGAAEQGLNRLACAVGIDQVARDLLVQGRGGERLLALLTLGRLAQPSDRQRVLQVMREDDPYVSLAAAHALVLIDPMLAVQDLLHAVAMRDDWPAAKIVEILKKAGADALSPVLERFFSRLPEKALPRLLPLLSAAHVEMAAPILNRALRQTHRLELVISALKLVNDPRSLDIARGLLEHGDWRVRMLAAGAIGRIGTRQDLDHLSPLLGDREWWVRYRAAQAIVRLPGIDGQAIRSLYEKSQDTFARNMLVHVVGETRLSRRVTIPAT